MRANLLARTFLAIALSAWLHCAQSYAQVNQCSLLPGRYDSVGNDFILSSSPYRLIVSGFDWYQEFPSVEVECRDTICSITDSQNGSLIFELECRASGYMLRSSGIPDYHEFRGQMLFRYRPLAKP